MVKFNEKSIISFQNHIYLQILLELLTAISNLAQFKHIVFLSKKCRWQLTLSNKPATTDLFGCVMKVYQYITVYPSNSSKREKKGLIESVF